MLVMDGTSAQPVPISGRGHILLVDDDAVFGESLSRVLQRAGFDVTLAADFRMALDVLESERPIDMLLTDIVMPASVNGIALSRMARLRRRAVKVVYMTGYDIPGVEREALGPILKKPIDVAVLLDEVERAMATQ